MDASGAVHSDPSDHEAAAAPARKRARRRTYRVGRALQKVLIEAEHPCWVGNAPTIAEEVAAALAQFGPPLGNQDLILGVATVRWDVASSHDGEALDIGLARVARRGKGPTRERRRSGNCHCVHFVAEETLPILRLLV